MNMLTKIAVGLIAIIWLSACASGVTRNFSEAERKQVTDVLRKYQIKEYQPVKLSSSSSYWIDDYRVLINSNQEESEKTPENKDHSAVVIFDTRTGATHRTGYFGSIYCYHDGIAILLRAPRATPDTPIYFKVDIRGEKKPMVAINELHKPGGQIIPFNCSFDLFRPNQPKREQELIKLRDGDGYVDFVSGDIFDENMQYVRFMPFHGRRYKAGDLRYSSWDKRYFLQTHAGLQSLLFNATGQWEIVYTPNLLDMWAQSSNTASSVPFHTRIGIIWRVQPWFAGWPLQGIYTQNLEEHGMWRLDNAEVSGLSVSPNGCKLFYYRKEGNPLNTFTTRKPAVMTLCKGE